MAIATIPGFPRFGPQRELKRALEGFWSDKRTEVELLATAAGIRSANWALQQAAGIDLIPVGDFSLYDHMLDMSALLGAVPDRYGTVEGEVTLDQFFAMARGRAKVDPVPAMDMTKWFDSNYHYIVPELSRDQTFRVSSSKLTTELAEATEQRIPAKAVLIGPLTWLALSKTTDGSDPLALLDRVLPVYAEVVKSVVAAGAKVIQFDESILVTGRFDADPAPLARAYAVIAEAAGSVPVWVQTAFGHPGAALDALLNLPVAGIGLDFTRGPQSLDRILASGLPDGKTLIGGVVDGRNIWRNDLSASFATLERLADKIGGDRLAVSSSSSLLHVPFDVALEHELDPDLVPWLAFARQKLDEIATLTRGLIDGRESIATELAASDSVQTSMRTSAIRNVPSVRDRVAAIDASFASRPAPFRERSAIQAATLGLPDLPTTTIGSFPQTGDLRNVRKAFETGEIDQATYDVAMAASIKETIDEQIALGLDVLVHGEPERNDMVQYFGEQLDGFIFTHNGWVQSYGSRMVRPPIIVGDVSRPEPMTVRWATYAQSLTERPVKGMLTGPVTILNWSFVRDDQPRSATCRQIALALRDEVADLEAAGIQIIQIDEPAIREGLPLRREDWDAYLDWATESFRIAAGVAKSETQIHTHMCYSAFEDVVGAIAALDADVLSIENARSDLAMLSVFSEFGYEMGIGPGVYDIHSPRVPDVDEMTDNLIQTLSLLRPNQVWVNPDCGLKTRRWEEVRPALRNMVAAAEEARSRVAVAV